MSRWRFKHEWIALRALTRQQLENSRTNWKLLVLTPILSTALYFLVFGEMLGQRIGQIAGHGYAEFIAPGLIMMGIFANSFSGTGSAFTAAKATNQINDLLITPTSTVSIVAGYVAGGVARGLFVGSALIGIVFAFIGVQVADFVTILLAMVSMAVLFSLAGLLNAALCRNPSHVGWLPLFVLSPLTYLGGVFFSIDMLDEPWRELALYNPMLYMINVFRLGFIGTSDVGVAVAWTWILLSVCFLFVAVLVLLERGYDLRD